MGNNNPAIHLFPRELRGVSSASVPATVLIVEDEALIAADLESRLCDLGYRVSAIAGSGEEAIERIEKFLPDLVLMDINIRGASDGIEVADLVRKRFDIPVVFLTAYQNRETLDRAKITAPFGYLIKPVRDGSLVSSIEVARYRHQMERKIREREAWLTTTLDSTADGVIVTDSAGLIRFLNDQARTLLGLGDPDLIGRKLSEAVLLKSKVTGAPAGDLFTLAVLQGATMDIGKDLVLDAPPGPPREIEGEVALCQMGGFVAGAVFTLRDVTIRNRQEDQKAQALRAHAITRLASAVTNDLCALLKTILDQSQSGLLAIPEEYPALKASMQQIVQNAEAGSRILNQLSRVSYPQFLFPKSVPLNSFMAGVAHKASSGIPARIQLKTCFGANVGNVLLDPNQMEPTMTDLIFYLLDCIPQAGQIDLQTENVSFERHGREGSVERYFRIILSGSGPVISQPSEDGLDLKFFVIQNAITGAKGSIRVETDPGISLKFDILLPEYKAEAPEPGRPAGDSPLVAKSVVLLIEEEFSVRVLLADYLISVGYEVLGARSGDEALDWCDLHTEPIDLLILPAALLSGDPAAQQITGLISDRPRMKVLALTDDASDPLPPSNTSQAVVHVLAKPFAREKLLKSIQDILLPVTA